MAYVNEVWVNHATDPQHVYKITQNSDGTYTITEAGTVVTKGTPMSADKFNHMEEGISENNETLMFLADMLRKAQDRIKGLTGEMQTVTLTNTDKYPFNNSQKTISLSTVKNTKDYRVLCEVVEKSGEGVGDIIVSDKLLNGFKIRYTGGATSVKMNLFVVGGM